MVRPVIGLAVLAALGGCSDKGDGSGLQCTIVNNSTQCVNVTTTGDPMRDTTSGGGPGGTWSFDFNGADPCDPLHPGFGTPNASESGAQSINFNGSCSSGQGNTSATFSPVAAPGTPIPCTQMTANDVHGKAAQCYQGNPGVVVSGNLTVSGSPGNYTIDGACSCRANGTAVQANIHFSGVKLNGA